MELDTVMTANPATCRPDTPLRQVATMMLENDCGMIPVVDEAGAPLGVVTDRDIAVRAVAAGKDVTRCSAGDYMTSPVRSVPMDTSLAASARASGCFRRARCMRALFIGIFPHRR